MNELEPFLLDLLAGRRIGRPLVRVVHIKNPSDFYVQMYRKKPFDEFYNMGQYCDDIVNNDKLETSDEVLLETCDGWRRNTVSALEASHIELRDLDFGISRMVEKSQEMYSLNERSRIIEPQALHCKLYWVRPICATGWTQQNTETMNNFLKDFKFVAEMELLQYQNCTLAVDLWNGDVDAISRKLIYVNEARFRM